MCALHRRAARHATACDLGRTVLHRTYECSQSLSLIHI